MIFPVAARSSAEVEEPGRSGPGSGHSHRDWVTRVVNLDIFGGARTRITEDG